MPSYIKWDSLREMDFSFIPDLANQAMTMAPALAATVGAGYLGSKQTALKNKAYGYIDKGINKVIDKVGGSLGANDSHLDAVKSFAGTNKPKFDFNQIKQPVADMVRREVTTQLASRGGGGGSSNNITDIAPPKPGSNAPKPTPKSPTLVPSVKPSTPANPPK